MMPLCDSSFRLKSLFGDGCAGAGRFGRTTRLWRCAPGGGSGRTVRATGRLATHRPQYYDGRSDRILRRQTCPPSASCPGEHVSAPRVVCGRTLPTAASVFACQRLSCRSSQDTVWPLSGLCLFSVWECLVTGVECLRLDVTKAVVFATSDLSKLMGAIWSQVSRSTGISKCTLSEWFSSGFPHMI